MVAADPALVHQVVAPAGSTLLFGETLVHATGPITSERERTIITTGCECSNGRRWAVAVAEEHAPVAEEQPIMEAIAENDVLILCGESAHSRAERARASMPTRGCAAVVGAFRELGRFGGARAAQWRRGSRAIDCFYSITSTLYELEARPRRMA